MASTSKFLQLTPQILVEYIYRDPLAPETIDTDVNGARIHILNDVYTDTNFVFNEDNPYEYTGNTRVQSAIPILADKSKYAYLTTNTALQYLDYDTNLISSADYQAQLIGSYNLPAKSIEYDSIKIHMLAGFDFLDSDGFIFEVLVRDRGARKHNLASLAYLKADNYEIINPKPLLIGERLYTKYILLKVPSLDWMTNEYLLSPGDTGIFANQLTNNIGLLTQSTIELTVKFINKTQSLNAQKYFYIGESSTAAINRTDEYSLLNAVVEESISGDYFEIYGEYNGDVYEDFILQLNQAPNTDIMVIHDISVFEQIGESFLLTTEQSFIQTNDYGEPYVFRPVILNSHIAVSYRIDYTLRLLNKVDNSQIIKQAQFSSFDVKKYGRRIRKINMGTVPTVTKVYNVLPEDVSRIVLNNPATPLSTGTPNNTSTQFVMGFRERLKVSAAVSNVKATPSVLQEGDITPTAAGASTQASNSAIEISQLTPTDNIWPQGEAIASISPFDNFILFVLYDNTLKNATGSVQPQLLDLTNMGTFYISFKNDASGEELRISNYTNVKDLSPVKGELLFKITKEESSKILKYNSRNFFISSKLELNNSKSDETMIYFGKWYKVDEAIAVRDSETIAELNQKLIVQSNTDTVLLSAATTEIEKLKESNLKLTEANNSLKTELSATADSLAVYNKAEAAKIRQYLIDGSRDVKELDKKLLSNKKKLGIKTSENSFKKLGGTNIKNLTFRP